MRHPDAIRRWAGAALALTLSVGALGACGSSSDKAADSDTGKPTTTSATAAGGNTAFCDSWVQVDTVANAGPDSPPDGPPSADAMTAFATALKSKLDVAAKGAPSDLADPLAKIQGIADKAASGGDPSELDPSNPALGAPLTTVEKWVHGNCGFATLDVIGVDYAFQGVPATIKAGVVSIKFENKAVDTEEHEMGIIRIKPGSKVTSDELLKAIETDPMGTEAKYANEVEFVGGVHATAGETSYTTMSLKPGDYIGGCFIPVGGKEGAELHVQKGMAVPFTVA